MKGAKDMNYHYLIRIIKAMNFHKITDCLDKVQEKTARNRFLIFIDLCICVILYGASFHDYMVLEFYRMKHSQRKTYLTRFKSKTLVTRLNNPASAVIFDQKTLFYQHFQKYLGRQFLLLEKATLADVEAFVQGKKAIIAKPSEGECGHGIEKIEPSSFQNIAELYAYLTRPDKHFDVIEDVVVQHEVINQLYPDAVNCFRLVTLIDDQKQAHVLYAVFKTGNHHSFVDNLESGGYSCHFDLEKEVISGPGHTSDMHQADAHPETGTTFRGFHIPFVKEAIAMVEEAALVLPDMRYVGWDVCITPTGPAIIEGNDYPGYYFPQFPEEGRERIGLLPLFQKYGIHI